MMSSRSYGIFLLFCLIGFSFAEYLSLNGNQWTTRSQNKSIVTKGTVPGSIYSDLRTSGILKDLLFGDNDINYRWVAWDNWTYERTFEVHSQLLDKEVVNLLIEGIDTVSSVYINDKKVGQTLNQFVRYVFNVKDVLKSGENHIRVEFESALSYSRNEYHWYEKTHYVLNPTCSAKEYHGECHWQSIRKMASSFSWDWGPAFPTQGIWKPIGIEAYDKAIIRDITVETIADKQYSKWTLTVNAFIELHSNQTIAANLSISLDKNILISNVSRSLIPNSDNTVRVEFVIPITNMSITPWFPNGVANNTQNLYELKVEMSFSDKTETSEQRKRIGFRKIDLIQTQTQPKGLTFYFEINSQPFFAKGTNWIPAQVLQEDITKEYIFDLMSAAKQANMNLMRVWGGGVYESDYLYELADEFGIMIWQDFMFACGQYPANPNFLKTVDEEVRTQVRRIQHHPSIAIWAGNNENIFWAITGRKEDLSKRKADYVELYINHIRKLLLQEDRNRPFVGSSSSNGAEDEKEGWVPQNDADWHYGDIHKYDYKNPLWNWRIYPSGRFASEYGYISYSSLETISVVVNESDLTFPISAALEHRQHHPGGTNSIEKEIGYYFKLPSKGGKERFNDLIYLSQITQAMAMKVETEFYRRNREIDAKTGNGLTMGALYWQLNDIWQGTTWSSIEFGGKWKVLMSFAIDFFKTQIIVPFEDTNQTLKVALVRDDYSGKLVFDFYLKVYKWSSTKPVNELIAKIESTKGFSSHIIWTQSITELLNASKCEDRSECVIKVDVPAMNATNFLLLSEPKNSKLLKPNIKLIDVKLRPKEENNKNVFEITLSTETVVPFVVLDFKLGSGLRGNFIENGFFIFDPIKTIQFETKSSNVTKQQIESNLIIKSITDVN